MAVKAEANAPSVSSLPVVRERQPRLIMKRYEYILNDELATLSAEEVAELFRGSSATDDMVFKSMQEGRLGVLMMHCHQKAFIRRFIKWVEAEEKKERRQS